MEIIKAPFTTEQVIALNFYQHRGDVHPYTCGGNRTDEKHTDGEGRLVATLGGWICPFCNYTQDWALGSMASPITMQEELLVVKMRLVGLLSISQMIYAHIMDTGMHRNINPEIWRGFVDEVEEINSFVNLIKGRMLW
jgi:hypothetical protein